MEGKVNVYPCPSSTLHGRVELIMKELRKNDELLRAQRNVIDKLHEATIKRVSAFDEAIQKQGECLLQQIRDHAAKSQSVQGENLNELERIHQSEIEMLRKKLQEASHYLAILNRDVGLE
eukprot:Filipodium_phascolosomae@DN5566_c0_g1_i1.p1